MNTALERKPDNPAIHSFFLFALVIKQYRKKEQNAFSSIHKTIKNISKNDNVYILKKPNYKGF